MIRLDESQQAALDMITTEPISIVTGGPGTGKTTILSAALDAMRAQGETVALCAPTGKAAKRMKEATGYEAQTIHRILKWNPTERKFYHGNDGGPVPYDVVIVDEASMIDVALFAALLVAIEPGSTRLVLVGDYNQLPSVGPGAILSDLVRSDLVPCARLVNVHRSAAGSWMCSTAPRILRGESIDVKDRDDFRFFEVDAGPNIPKIAGDAYEKLRAQILVPQKTGKAGADAINVALQERFNPKKKGAPQWGKAPHLLRVGDPVIHVRNNYDLGVFNGECGHVVSIEEADRAKDTPALLSVQYPDRRFPTAYTKGDAFDLRLAYALTIHKSQGSEWPWVIVVAHSTHSFMLTRQLLYTAVTRGKQGVCIVGNKPGIKQALKTNKDAKRNTALCDRIRGEL